ncbi:MAG: hypothetical protein ACRCU2_28760, partial [Planktothrix sp.]
QIMVRCIVSGAVCLVVKIAEFCHNFSPLTLMIPLLVGPSVRGDRLPPVLPRHQFFSLPNTAS